MLYMNIHVHCWSGVIVSADYIIATYVTGFAKSLQKTSYIMWDWRSIAVANYN